MENTSTDNFFEKNFNYGSLVSLFIFVLGVYIMYLILKKDYSQAFFYMLVSFIIYIINNIKQNLNNSTTAFNEELENLASFFTFTVNLILFGIVFYKGDSTILFLILFFAICSVLSMTRSSVSNTKNSVGFPITLNGLFFPLIYYVYVFYLQSPGSSIFLVYYLVVAILSISKNNYIEFEEIIEKQVRNNEREKPTKKENLDEESEEKNVNENIILNEAEVQKDVVVNIESTNRINAKENNLEEEDILIDDIDLDEEVVSNSNSQKEDVKEEKATEDFNDLDLETYKEENLDTKEEDDFDKFPGYVDESKDSFDELKSKKKHKGLISFIVSFFKKKDKVETHNEKENINSKAEDDFDKFPGYVDESKDNFDELRSEDSGFNLDEENKDENKEIDDKENFDTKEEDDFDKFPGYVDESKDSFDELKSKKKHKGLISFIVGFFNKKNKVETHNKKENIDSKADEDFDKFPGYVDESKDSFSELKPKQKGLVSFIAAFFKKKNKIEKTKIIGGGADIEEDVQKHKTITDDNKII